ncbi:hypothetical protein EV644_10923 [Kribbella orskensis]|uniref:Uncharacterized protein n=1 Tax=Kribbella orskensis TaxID=2512216 RepID=A0ABY2BGW1_9ACTN|nr:MULTISPECIES: hypothetical protein [Kribbella]TCN38466.1 hypothetical protein EV642_109253 [Kribbella sp. VKM Ac-2500]TCO20004.1 hypothetical protein EV644_10923 [Kribbella orskensis]
MTALERWHVGPWTTRGTLPGEPLEPGRKRTPDELNFDIVGLARILGRRLSGREELQVRLWQNELRPTHTRRCGVHTLADPGNSRLLAETAQKALAWLASRAPEGYEFVLTDAVCLRPLTELAAETVTVDAVVQLAAERGDALPADRLAASHVRRSSAGEWFAGDAVCNWSGPYPTAEEAADAIRAARVELTNQLTESGHSDLAATFSRWSDVHVEPAV